jgi:hypothetical protein
MLESPTNRDANLARLDDLVAKLHSQMLTLAFLVKQRFFLPAIKGTVEPKRLFTQGDLASYFKVTPRTVRNWIASGLEASEIGGVTRISWEAIEKFKQTNTRRKFGWRSISQKPDRGLSATDGIDIAA